MASDAMRFFAVVSLGDILALANGGPSQIRGIDKYGNRSMRRVLKNALFFAVAAVLVTLYVSAALAVVR